LVLCVWLSYVLLPYDLNAVEFACAMCLQSAFGICYLFPALFYMQLALSVVILCFTFFLSQTSDVVVCVCLGVSCVLFGYLLPLAFALYSSPSCNMSFALCGPVGFDFLFVSDI